MRDTSSITDIQGNSWGTMFLEGDTGAVWYVSSDHTVSNILPAGGSSISVGHNHCAVVTRNGEAITFQNRPDSNDGASSYVHRGQHGTGDYNPRLMELVCSNVRNVVSAHCGGGWTVLLDRDGVTWFAGDNDYGVAGVGRDSRSLRSNNVCEREFIPTRDNVRSVHAGPNHCFVSDKTGELLFAGRNVCHAGGFGYSSPHAQGANCFVSTGLNAVEVHTSHRKSLVLDSDGIWWHTGDARQAPGSVSQTNLFFPKEKWGQVAGLDLRRVKLRGDYDGVGISSSGEMAICGSSKVSQKYGKYFGSLHGVTFTEECGQDVAVTESATFVLRNGEWYSAGPANSSQSLGPLDARTRHYGQGTGFFKMAHPEVWHLALNLASMGIPWDEAVDGAASMM